MAITYTRPGAISPSTYRLVTSSYTGPLKDFQYTMSSGRPDSKYFVGYTFDASDGGLSRMVVNGTTFGTTYTPGSGSYRKTNGTGTVTADSSGRLYFSGSSTATATVKGALQVFAVPIES